MNVENWKLLRESVASSVKFDMRDFFHKCGTPACLVGHVASILIQNNENILDEKVFEQRKRLVHVGDTHLARWLGVSYSQLHKILMGKWSYNHLDNITQEEALYWIDECLTLGYVSRI